MGQAKAKKLFSGVRIYCKYIKMHFLCGLEYKGWWMMVIQVLLTVVTDPIATLLLFSRFGSIGPWSVERIILIYSIAVTSFGLAESLCRGFDYFPFRMLQNGEFDRVLLRPRSLTLQVAASYFHIHRLARVAAGLVVIFWSLFRQGIAFTPARALILFLALAGGLITYCGVFIMTSGIAFFTVKGLDWIYIFTNASYQVTRCPVELMPRILRNIFTFFMPMLVISYYPASVICGWGEPLWKGVVALPAGIAFLVFALAIWRIGVRHYKSTGS